MRIILTINEKQCIPAIMKIVVFIDILCSCVCLFYVFDATNIINIVAVLPIAYTIEYLLVSGRIDYSNPACIVTIAIENIRYELLPLVMILSNSLSYFARGYQNMQMAVVLMIYEMTFINFVLIFKTTARDNCRNIIGINSSFIKYIAIIAAVLLLYDNRNLFGNLSVLTGMTSVSTDEIAQTSGIITILWQAIFALVFCFLINDIYSNENISQGKKLLLSATCSMVYLFLIYTGQVRISRWYTLVTVVSIVFWLIKMYPNYSKRIFAVVFVPAGIILLIASIVKNTAEGLSADIGKSILSVISATNLDIYFAGPVSVNNAIAAKKFSNVNISYFINDLLISVPYLNHFIEGTTTTNFYGNYLGRTDQILPLVGQSAFCFGYILSPLFSIIMILIAKKQGERFIKTKGITAYLHAFFCIWSSISPILNITIWISWVYSRIIPAFLLFHLVTKKLRTRKSMGIYE